MNKFAVFEAIAVLVGTIIGAGVFVLPYVSVQSGMLLTLGWLAAVSFIIIFLHLSFGEIILRTKEKFCLPGYIGYYLNPVAKKFILLVTFIFFSFSLLVYLLLGSQFLETVLSVFFPENTFSLGLLVFSLWLCLSLVILTNGKKLSRINFYLSFILLCLFFIIALLAQPYFKINNLNLFRLDNSQWGWLIPYGVFFFGLNGLVAIPEAIKVLEKKQISKNKVKQVIILGTLIPLFCYLLFIIIVAGVSGSSTTIDAILGLKNILGNGIILLGACLGFLAVVTSYLIFGSYIKDSFISDFKWTPFISYFLVIAGPIFIYLLQLEDLVKLISFLGGMLGGFEGMMVLLVLQKAKKQGDLEPPYKMPLNKIFLIILILAFIIGAICQTFLVY